MTADPRDRFLSELLQRLARSEQRDAFVLRGGVLTRFWIRPHERAARDLDFVGDFPFDREATRTRFAAAVGNDRITARGMWEHTAFPGVRLQVPVEDITISVDVGFNDPLVPPATELVLGEASLRAVRPETQVAWKLHGLVEMGGEWRPKDLADLALITAHVALERAVMPAAIEAAFTSRGYAPDLAEALWRSAHWTTKTARLRWEPYERRHGPLANVVAAVAAHLGELR